MIDAHGRNIEYLRISVTENCNLKCLYCSPSDCSVAKKQHTILTPQEYKSIVSIIAGLGINKVRVTGGEPLVRRDICEIISNISAVPDIADISMTTNGINLEVMAKQLKESGLKRLNISLDSLQAEKFKNITGMDKLSSVLSGIDKAISVGLKPVKVNTVLIKGINDSEIDDFIEFTKNKEVDVRFIELMPIGKFGQENRDKIIYNSDIISTHPELIPCEIEDLNQPAQYYKIDGYKGKVGFISPMSHKFCNRCNRIRLTSDGKLKPCLGNNGEVDISEFLGQPKMLEDVIKKTIYEKPVGHNFEKDFVSSRNMNAIGG